MLKMTNAVFFSVYVYNRTCTVTKPVFKEERCMINFVVGPACAGKSTFIKQYFKDWKVLDVLDFQRKFSTNPDGIHVDAEGVTKGHFAFTEEIVNNVDKDIVVEHTLFKIQRRIDILDAIHEKGHPQVNIYVVMATEEEIKENHHNRFPEVTYPLSYKIYKCKYKEIEPYSREQGFSHIYVVRRSGDSWQVEEVDYFNCKDEFEWPVYEIDLYEVTKDIPNAQGDNCKKMEHLIYNALWAAEDEIGDDIVIRFKDRMETGNAPLDLWVNRKAREIAQRWGFELCEL